jgi:hypothetical protein
MRWVRRYANENCKKPEPQGEIVIELDEMRHFIRSKKLNFGFGKLIAELPANSSIGN